jgi:hypothetical protein
VPSNLPIDGHSFRRVEVLTGDTATATLERGGEASRTTERDCGRILGRAADRIGRPRVRSRLASAPLARLLGPLALGSVRAELIVPAQPQP